MGSNSMVLFVTLVLSTLLYCVAMTDNMEKQHAAFGSGTKEAFSQATPNHIDNAVTREEQSHRRLTNALEFPECLTMTVEECAQFIASVEPELKTDHIKIAYPRKFNFYRIWIEVDENGIVINTPERG
mmetsp:Transcript_11104/g.14026  ORF Transcript_11104/g.14026 Transcript_11104/m.14026 type:complete len:128 (-) Transcript_11104:284-667(-)